jgi:hypothetical protein
MSASQTVTDLTRGVYRRQYAGFINGKRINAVSLEAEAWFWRVHTAAADDFGNLPGESSLIAYATIGRRGGVSVEQVEAWCGELLDADLLRYYEVSNERYIHVVGFLNRQPAPRNGKRIRRYPKSPYEDTDIRGSPDSSICSDSDAHSDTDTDSEDPRSTEGSPEPPAASVPPLLVFPTIGNGPRFWNFTEVHRGELASAYENTLDVMTEARKALVWVKADLGRRKTARGMMKFLIGWMNKAIAWGTHSGGGRANGKPDFTKTDNGSARQKPDSSIHENLRL